MTTVVLVAKSLHYALADCLVRVLGTPPILNPAQPVWIDSTAG